MVRVELKNFQSIADEVIEIDGFSAVAGKSNIGKSAIVRAIKAAITGAPVECYVRHSETCVKRAKGAKTCKCFCSVRIVGNGVDLLWEKGDAVNRYVYNGVEQTAVGRGTPEFLGPEFGMINLGPRDRTVLQVSDQFHPLFILDKSGTVIADVLSDVAKLDQINVAIRLSEKDRKEAASTRKVRERDIADIKQNLIRYDGLDGTLARVKSVEDTGRRVEKTELEIARLVKYYDTLTTIARGIKALAGVSAITIPEVALSGHAAKIRALSAYERTTQERSAELRRLSGVTAVAEPSIEAFGGLSSSFRNLTRWVGKVQALKAFFARTDKAATASPPELTGLQKAKEDFAKLDKWAQRLAELVKVNGQLRKDLVDAEASEAAVLASFSELGLCPTCKQDVKAVGHTHQEVQAHA